MYLKRTKQNYEIKKIVSYHEPGRIERIAYAIIAYRERLKDYVIGLNYDFYRGEWAQGKYEFKSVEEATNYLYNNKQLWEIY